MILIGITSIEDAPTFLTELYLLLLYINFIHVLYIALPSHLVWGVPDIPYSC